MPDSSRCQTLPVVFGPQQEKPREACCSLVMPFAAYLCIFIDINRVLQANHLGTEDFTVSLEAVQLKQAGS